MTFTVAIVGRPNVGKSTIFNRIVGKKLAIVHDTPGVTRDWRMAEANMFDITFNVIDTAGLEESFDDSIHGRMRQQTERAMEQADMVLLVIDGRDGVTSMDQHFASWLRKQKLPSVLVANKCESNKGIEGMYEAYELGLGEPIAISAEHNLGFGDLREVIEEQLKTYEEANPPEQLEQIEDDLAAQMEKYKEGDEVGFGDEETTEEEEKPIRIAIVGRPNVGKSTLLNAILKEERSMVGAEAGITRDAVHAKWEFDGKQMNLVDTAGMRKRARVIDKIEMMSVDDAIRAIRLAQIVILVIDAELTIERQDLTIAQHIIDEGRGLVIAVNKWDLIEDKKELMEEIEYQLERNMSEVKNVKVTTISALNGHRLNQLFQSVLETWEVWNKRVPTAKLNKWIGFVESRHPAPLVNGRPNRLRYITQIKTRPPTFAMWVGRADNYPDTHKKYVINRLRKDFDIPATPIRVIIKKSKNPYGD